MGQVETKHMGLDEASYVGREQLFAVNEAIFVIYFKIRCCYF
jgi:hypothetical protein